VSDTYRFALIMSWISAVVLVAVLANRLTDRFKLPAPLLMLVAAAVAAQLVPGLPVPSEEMIHTSRLKSSSYAAYANHLPSGDQS